MEPAVWSLKDSQFFQLLETTGCFYTVKSIQTCPFLLPSPFLPFLLLPPLFFPPLSFPRSMGRSPVFGGEVETPYRIMKTNLRMIWLANIVEFLQMSGNCFDSPPQIHRVLGSAKNVLST